MNRHLVTLTGFACAFAFVAVPGSRLSAQGCERDSTAAPREPFSGFTTTSYKGGPERDDTWFRDVRTLRNGTAPARFALRREASKPVTEYESIEPASLGGRTAIYVGWRGGCGEFVDAAGRRRWSGSFSDVQSAWRLRQRDARDSVWLIITQRDSAGDGYRYLIASRNRVVAQSPRLYRTEYSRSLGEFTYLPDGMVIVAAQFSGGIGAIDAATLRERLAPRWHGIGGLAHVVDGQLVNQYLLTDDGSRLWLFRTTGTPVVVPPFHRVEAIEGWSRLNWRGPFARIFALSDTLTSTCRVYDGRMQPIVHDVIRTTRDWDWKCQRLTPLFTGDSAQYLVFTDANGLTQSYRVSRHTITQTAHDVTGEALHVFRNGAWLSKRVNASGATVYQTVSPNGTPYPTAIFSDIRILGCGFVHVQRDGKWYSPGEDGSVDVRLGMPFSC